MSITSTLFRRLHHHPHQRESSWTRLVRSDDTSRSRHAAARSGDHASQRPASARKGHHQSGETPRRGQLLWTNTDSASPVSVSPSSRANPDPQACTEGRVVNWLSKVSNSEEIFFGDDTVVPQFVGCLQARGKKARLDCIFNCPGGSYLREFGDGLHLPIQQSRLWLGALAGRHSSRLCLQQAVRRSRNSPASRAKPKATGTFSPPSARAVSATGWLDLHPSGCPRMPRNGHAAPPVQDAQLVVFRILGPLPSPLSHRRIHALPRLPRGISAARFNV